MTRNEKLLLMQIAKNQICMMQTLSTFITHAPLGEDLMSLARAQGQTESSIEWVEKEV